MNIINSCNNMSAFIKSNSPKILVASSMLLGAGACVASGVATWYTKDILEEHNSDIDDLHWDLKSAKTPEEEKEIKVNIFKRYAKTVAMVGANYLPAAAMMTGSVICGTKGIISYEKEIAVIGAGCLALKSLYDNAKERVEEKYGEEEAAELFYGTKETEKEVTDENGNKFLEKVKEYDPYGIIQSNPCAILLGEGIESNLTDNLWYDIQLIKSLESKYTYILNSKGYVLVQDIYKELGVEPKSRYQHDLWSQYGWVKDQNRIDNYINKCHLDGTPVTDDGIIKANSVTLGLDNVVNSKYLEGREPMIWLIPNCIGDIMPIIFPNKQMQKYIEASTI